MRVFLAALLAGIVGLMSAALAQPYDSPDALLEAFYAPYLSGDFPDDDASFRSAALNALYAADAEATPPGELGALDFDPYIDGQDYEISNLEIGSPSISGETATVEVRFDNFDQPTSLTYDLVLENGGWKIDDVASENPEFPYRLSEIFAGARADQGATDDSAITDLEEDLGD
ncbi:DUF3828 domain-containing protein [Devosia sp. PTR5]|uniref:DUF3828 domain-containing protein n=1 Tax=Devosia oryzisoli TaxID=2774138 RepID=A0A927FRR3_9HYPH|nr:DUF3828 domain-containing protein [Devosia oryzisoli]MBD8064192.1 DUF3828 domain-containing protein [Devosia oryzisoli]